MTVSFQSMFYNNCNDNNDNYMAPYRPTLTFLTLCLDLYLQNKWRSKGSQVVTTQQVWSKYLQPFCLQSSNRQTYQLTDSNENHTPSSTTIGVDNNTSTNWANDTNDQCNTEILSQQLWRTAESDAVYWQFCTTPTAQNAAETADLQPSCPDTESSSDPLHSRCLDPVTSWSCCPTCRADTAAQIATYLTQPYLMQLLA